MVPLVLCIEIEEEMWRREKPTEKHIRRIGNEIEIENENENEYEYEYENWEEVLCSSFCGWCVMVGGLWCSES